MIVNNNLYKFFLLDDLKVNSTNKYKHLKPTFYCNNTKVIKIFFLLLKTPKFYKNSSLLLLHIASLFHGVSIMHKASLFYSNRARGWVRTRVEVVYAQS